MSNRPLVVFDLDDTLYSERSYVNSGIKYVVDTFERLTSISLPPKDLENLLTSKSPLDEIMALFELAPTVKESLLWMYRLHHPNISLYRHAVDFLEYCEQQSLDYAVLTDGRLSTQLFKLESLGLAGVKAYISEQFQDLKPSKNRFLQIEKDYPQYSYIYVGDNPSKDFLAPNELGWVTVGLKYQEHNIHSYDLKALPPSYLPSFWVDELSEIKKIIHEGLNK